MAYTHRNFPTKKALKEAVAAGDDVTIYSPSGIFPVKTDGIEDVEGPHYPRPHTWYAEVKMVGGFVVSVK